MAQTFSAPKALWVLSLIGIGMWVAMTLYVGVDGIVHAFSNRVDLTSIPTTTTTPPDPINSDGSINYDALPDGIKMSIIVMSLWTLTANVAFVGAILGIVYVSMRFHKVWRAVAFGVVGIGAPVLAGLDPEVWTRESRFLAGGSETIHSWHARPTARSSAATRSTSTPLLMGQR